MDNLNIDFRKGKIEGEISGKVFQSDGYWIFYAPSLDLSAYGETQKEAEEHFFNVYLQDYFEELIKSPKKALTELEKLGWKKSLYFKKRFTSDSYVDKNGFLQKFDLPEGTPVFEKSVPIEL